MRASRMLAHAVAGALVLGAVVSAHAAEGEPCAAWPGEPSPLPTIEDGDAFSARWAKLRVDELTAVATRIVATDPSSAYRLWQHVRCLAPRDTSVPQQLAAIVPLKEVVKAPVVARPAPAPERREPPPFAAVDTVISEAAAALDQARFREALDAGTRARRLLDAMGTSPDVRRRQARLEVMAGTAELALDLEDAAALSLRRALRADPALSLDESTPPKVRRLFLTVRASIEKAAQQP